MNFQEQQSIRLSQHVNGEMPKLGPESVGVVLTNACNLNCITCWSYSPLLNVKPQKEWKNQQLPFDVTEKLIFDLVSLGTKRIILTGGGDPLVYSYFYETVELAKKSGLKVTLISNLTLIKDFERFLSLNIDTIQANFSAADAQSYVDFHPNRKLIDFDKLLEKLSVLASKTEDLKLVCVVCKTNYHSMAKIIELAAELKTKIQFKLMSVNDDTSAVAINDEQRVFLLNEEQNLKQLTEKNNVKTNLNVFFKTLKGENVFTFPIEDIGCFAGNWYSRIHADGSVRFCCNPNDQLTIGSLHKNTFSEIWNNDSYQKIREKLRNNNFVKGCDKCGKFDLNYKMNQLLSNEQLVK